MVFQRKKITGCRGAVNVSHATDRRSSKMHCHGHSVFFRHVADLMGFKNAARRCEIGMNFAHSVFLAEHAEGFFQVDVFSGEDRGWALFGNLLKEIGVGPGDYVFHPGKVVLFVGFSEPNN